MNESDSIILQNVVEYYRNKCSKLEYDFILYRAQSQRFINELTEKLNQQNESQGLGHDSREEDDSA